MKENQINIVHDDVIKCKKKKTFSTLLAICAGNSPLTAQNQRRWPLILSLICAWINGWVNNREAGDLRGHSAHYDVTVMHRSDIAGSRF